MEHHTENLTLILLYLASWEEKVFDETTVTRAWKNHRFEILDDLEAGGYLAQSRKSITFTEKGLAQAQLLLETYLPAGRES
ncbi:MAG: transposase [Anaerolineae bacterium]|nr:transposase [Anaerolineae bacterium]